MPNKLYELEELPFISKIPNDGRNITSLSFYDDTKNKYRTFWEYQNKFIEMASGGRELIKGVYWSKKQPGYKNDIYFDLINLLSNNFSFDCNIKGKKPGLLDISTGLLQDIHNFGAVIHKQLIIWDYVKSFKKPYSRVNIYDIYATEVEYLMGLVRSFFDLIYKVYILLSEITTPKMANFSFKKVNTLGSLSDRVINAIKESGNELNQVEILKSFDIPDTFIKYFDIILPFFRLCRRIRDRIFHEGKTPEIIFILDNGPGIGMKNLNPYLKDPYSGFKDFFKGEPNFEVNLLENDIVSLFYFINMVIGYSLDYAQMFAQAMRIFYKQMPESISDDYKMFIRGPDIKYLNRIPNYLIDAWMEPLDKSFFKPENLKIIKIT